MKDKVKEMLKNVIEENAIKFKASTSDALYNKIGNRLKDEYKTVAKKMFSSLQESNYGIGSSIAQGVGSSEEVSAAMAPPSSRERDSEGTEPGNTDMDRPYTTSEEWLRTNPRPEVRDFDKNGDGLDAEERRNFEEVLREWYERWIRILQEEHEWKHRRKPNPPKFKKPSFDFIRNQAYNFQKPKPIKRAVPPRRS